MLLPYRMPSDSNKRRQKTSSDLKRPQLASKKPNHVVDSVTKTVELVKNGSLLDGSGNLEIDDEYSIDILHHNNKYRLHYIHTIFLFSGQN